MGIEGLPKQPPKKVEMSSKTIERVPPSPGGTLMVMQRHGNYDRKTGHLTPEGRINSLERSRKAIIDIVEQVPAAERQNITLLVVASPTVKNEGQRSVETAGAVIESARNVFAEYGIPKENILTEAPRQVEAIEEPRIFKDRTEYRHFLEEKYGQGSKEFWKAYEEDTHKEEREKMVEEGPVEMSDRFAHYANVLARYSRAFHSKHKEKPGRLIVWNVSHYDTVTTFFKNHVAGIPQKEYVPVDYDGGMSVLIDPSGEASIKVEGTTYPVDFNDRGTSLKRKNE